MQHEGRPLVLLTDGDERATLAAARSLQAVGARVLVAARSRISLAGASRGVRARQVVSDPLGDPAGFAAEIGRIADEESAGDRCVLIPMTDATVEAVLSHQTALPAHVILPLPSLDQFRAASDKQGRAPASSAQYVGNRGCVRNAKTL